MKKNKFLDFVLACICALMNLSQLPAFVENETTSILSSIAIIIVGVYIFLRPSTYRTKTGVTAKRVKLLVMLFLIVQLFIYTFNYNLNYFGGSLSRAFYITILLYFIGYFLGDDFTDRTVNWILFSYVVTSCILAVVIYDNYLIHSLNSRVYAYSSKNSVSMILFVAVVLLGVVFKPKVKIYKLFKIIAIAGLTYVIVLLKSRAVILCYFILIAYMFSIRDISFSKKFFSIMIICIIGFMFAVEQDVFNTFVDKVILSGRDSGNIDDISSGRVGILQSFPTLINNNWFSGIGNIYFECFYLSVILNYGIIGSIIILSYSLYPVKWIFSVGRNNNIMHCFAILALCYAVNGVFEGLSPFGPGAKCYLLWLMFGLLSRLGDLRDMSNNESNNLK